MEMLIFLYILVGGIWGLIDLYVAKGSGVMVDGKEVAKIFLRAMLWPARVAVVIYKRLTTTNPVPPV